LTDSSAVSPHVSREIEAAIRHKRSLLVVSAKPAVLTDELQYFLSSSHWLDISGATEVLADGRVLGAVEALISESSGTVPRGLDALRLSVTAMRVDRLIVPFLAALLMSPLALLAKSFMDSRGFDLATIMGWLVCSGVFVALALLIIEGAFITLTRRTMLKRESTAWLGIAIVLFLLLVSIIRSSQSDSTIPSASWAIPLASRIHTGHVELLPSDGWDNESVLIGAAIVGWIGYVVLRWLYQARSPFSIPYAFAFIGCSIVTIERLIAPLADEKDAGARELYAGAIPVALVAIALAFAIARIPRVLGRASTSMSDDGSS
jgi:hypothetical protein